MFNCYNKSKLLEYLEVVSADYSKEIDQGVYCEDHHIMPRCMGGSNDKDNIVKLPSKYHFIAHKLLAEAHSTNTKYHQKLCHAYQAMCLRPKHLLDAGAYTPTAEEYANAKELFIQSRKGHKRKAEIGEKISKKLIEYYKLNPNPMLGINHSEATKKKIRETRGNKYKGKNHSRYDPTIYSFKNVKTGEEFGGVRKELAEKFSMSLSGISDLIKYPSRISRKGWTRN